MTKHRFPRDNVRPVHPQTRTRANFGVIEFSALSRCRTDARMRLGLRFTVKLIYIYIYIIQISVEVLASSTWSPTLSPYVRFCCFSSPGMPFKLYFPAPSLAPLRLSIKSSSSPVTHHAICKAIWAFTYDNIVSVLCLSNSKLNYLMNVPIDSKEKW